MPSLEGMASLKSFLNLPGLRDLEGLKIKNIYYYKYQKYEQRIQIKKTSA